MAHCFSTNPHTLDQHFMSWPVYINSGWSMNKLFLFFAPVSTAISDGGLELFLGKEEGIWGEKEIKWTLLLIANILSWHWVIEAKK